MYEQRTALVVIHFRLFFASPSCAHTCHNFLKISNGDAYTKEKHKERERERKKRRRRKKKKYRDLFDLSAAFGTSLHINK